MDRALLVDRLLMPDLYPAYPYQFAHILEPIDDDRALAIFDAATANFFGSRIGDRYYGSVLGVDGSDLLTHSAPSLVRDDSAISINGYGALRAARTVSGGRKPGLDTWHFIGTSNVEFNGLTHTLVEVDGTTVTGTVLSETYTDASSHIYGPLNSVLVPYTVDRSLYFPNTHFNLPGGGYPGYASGGRDAIVVESTPGVTDAFHPPVNWVEPYTGSDNESFDIRDAVYMGANVFGLLGSWMTDDTPHGNPRWLRVEVSGVTTSVLSETILGPTTSPSLMHLLDVGDGSYVAALNGQYFVRLFGDGSIGDFFAQAANDSATTLHPVLMGDHVTFPSSPSFVGKINRIRRISDTDYRRGVSVVGHDALPSEVIVHYLSVPNVARWRDDIGMVGGYFEFGGNPRKPAEVGLARFESLADWVVGYVPL